MRHKKERNHILALFFDGINSSSDNVSLAPRFDGLGDAGAEGIIEGNGDGASLSTAAGADFALNRVFSQVCIIKD
jgi:hypothetical protein